MNAWLNYVGCGCIALSVLACGSKGEDDGGEEETGGTSGSGGSSTGGSSTGGTSTGGTSTGGTSTGGSSGSGPLPPTTTISFDAASDVCADPLTDPNVANCWKLVDSNADMATSMPIPDADIHWEHNADDGDPDPGAFQATIPYDQPSQWVSFGVNFNAVDMTRRVISARVKIVSGLGDADDLMTAPAGLKVYAKSGMIYCYGNGAYFTQGTIGEWTTVEFDLTQEPGYLDAACADSFDPSDIREIGVQIDTNSASTTAQEAVVLIDNVTY